MKKVIELIRVSTESQAGSDRASIPAQRTINERTAKAYGLKIVKIIQMSDVSGAAVLLAPEMQELLALIKDPDIHGVVCREFSRLMRPEDFSDYVILQTFVETNTSLYLPDGPIDLSTKSGRFMALVRAGMAGMERTEILERMWSAKEEKRRLGKLAQSKNCLPFGVDYDDKTGSWSYTEEAEQVRRAFKLLLSGDTNYRSIARQVGIAHFNLRNLLKKPIYTGWRVIDQRRDPSPGAKRTKKDGRQGDRPKITRAPDEIIRVRVIERGLISEADFNRAQELIRTKRTRHWRTRTGYEHRFTYNGFLTCSYCGENIYSVYSRHDYYI